MRRAPAAWRAPIVRSVGRSDATYPMRPHWLSTQWRALRAPRLPLGPGLTILGRDSALEYSGLSGDRGRACRGGRWYPDVWQPRVSGGVSHSHSWTVAGYRELSAVRHTRALVSSRASLIPSALLFGIAPLVYASPLRGIGPSRWLAEAMDVPEVSRRDPNGGAIDRKQVRCSLRDWSARLVTRAAGESAGSGCVGFASEDLGVSKRGVMSKEEEFMPDGEAVSTVTVGRSG